MLSSQVRSSQTSQGLFALSPWYGDGDSHIFSALNLGNNFISSLEIVSALNTLNLGRDNYNYNFNTCLQKYNPKVYFGAFHTVPKDWNYDKQTGQTNGLQNLVPDAEKSGSWPLIL